MSNWVKCPGCGTEELGHHEWRGRRSPRCSTCMERAAGTPRCTSCGAAIYARPDDPAPECNPCRLAGMPAETLDPDCADCGGRGWTGTLGVPYGPGTAFSTCHCWSRGAA